MSHTSRSILLLRSVLILLSPPSIFFISTLSSHTPSFTLAQHTLQARLCMLLCAPLAASSVVSLYITLKARLRVPVDAALVLALDVVMGSVLLLTAVAGWFVMRAESTGGLDGGLEAWARWGVVPLVAAFCIHYFLAFASLENGVLVTATGTGMPVDEKAGFRAVLFAGMDEKASALMADPEQGCEKDAPVCIGWSSNSVV